MTAVPLGLRTVRHPAPGLGRVGRTAVLALVLVWVMLLAALTAKAPMLGLGAAVGSAVFLIVPSMQDRVGVNPWWPVFVIAAIQPLNGIRPVSGAAIGDFGLVLLAMLVIPTVRQMYLPARVFIPLVGTLVLAAGGLLGTVVSQDFLGGSGAYGGSGLLIFKFLVGAPLVILLISAMNPSPAFATVLARGYAVGAAISSVAAMAGRTDPYFQRAFGFGAHQMHLALSAMFGALVALGWFLSTRVLWERIFSVALGAICTYGMLLSGSRSALLGFFAGLVYLAVLGRTKGIAALLGLGSLGFAGLWELSNFMPQGSTLYRLFGHGDLSSQTVASNDLHLVAANQAISEIAQSPLTGLGFGQGLDAHNLFLEAANIGGALGIVGMVLIWGTMTALWLRVLSEGVSREQWLPASMLAGVLGYFVLGQLENIIWDRHLWFFITLTLIAVPTARGRTTGNDPEGEVGDDVRHPSPGERRAERRALEGRDPAPAAAAQGGLGRSRHAPAPRRTPRRPGRDPHPPVVAPAP